MSALTRFIFFAGDLLLLNLSIFFSLFFLGDLDFDLQDKASKVYLVVYSNLSWLFLVMVSTPYNLTKGLGLSKILKNQLAFVFIHLLVVGSLILFLNKTYSLVQIGFIYIIFVPFYFLYRIVFFYFRKVLTAEVKFKNYILIGRNALSSEIRKYFLLNPDLKYKFSGYFDEYSAISVEQIRSFCLQREVHEIYCCLPNVEGDDLKKLVEFGLDSLIKVKIVVQSESPSQAIQLEKYDQLPGFNLAAIPLDETLNKFFKRTFDIIFSGLFTLLVLSWLIPIIGILIKLDSAGPIFFIQLRSGEANKAFRCLKFRTMIVNKEADTAQATKGDSRITKLGHILRTTSIDELPQFINVLLGSMSVVGPRPHMLSHTQEYAKLIDQFMGRHYVKPGITGLAQCMGYRGEIQSLSDMENRVRLDRYYIENWSFWLDIKIVFLTVVSLIRGSDKAF